MWVRAGAHNGAYGYLQMETLLGQLGHIPSVRVAAQPKLQSFGS
jgi:hypothetical protein